MFIALLTFSDNKDSAAQFMSGHKEWLKRGSNDRRFLLAGSQQPNLGGGILAHDTSRDELQNRMSDDPFVRANVVSAKIHEITPVKTDARLNFLLD